MKTSLALFAFLLSFSLLPAAEPAPASDQTAPPAKTAVSARAFVAQIRAIEDSPKLTPKEKADQITAAVRDTIANAIGELKDAPAILKTTLRFARLAAAAAPQFTDAIISGIAAIPSISAINGALAQIQAVVVDTATRAAEANFSSDDDRRRNRHRDREPDGDDDDVVVSPSR
ncbi:MAG TPA: hypothetical protein VMI53_10760 [Opitutaceae bacterium]|nr:hypothetical protein [Opitutaceae bacterium]